MIKDEPITSHASNNFYPIYCENGDDILIIQIFDKDHKRNIRPLRDYNISLDLIALQNRYKRKQVKKPKSLAAPSATLNDTVFHSDNDNIIDRRIPTRAELNYIQPELRNLPNINRNLIFQVSYLKQISALNCLNRENHRHIL